MDILLLKLFKRTLLSVKKSLAKSKKIKHNQTRSENFGICFYVIRERLCQRLISRKETGHFPIFSPDFLFIFNFPNNINLKRFSNSRGHPYTKNIISNSIFHFACTKSKLHGNLVKCQNILSSIAVFLLLPKFIIELINPISKSKKRRILFR